MRLPLRSEDRELRDALLKYNRTELYQTCRKVGIPVHPTASVEKMVDCLLGIDVPEARSHAIDEIRYAQMDFLREHRSTLGLQIRCPAQSMERTACFSCVDTQVLSCLLSSGHQDAILRHRKHLNVIQQPPPKDYLPMSNSNIVAASPEDLKSNLKRRRIAEELGISGEGASPEQRKAWFSMTPEQQVAQIEAEYARRGLRGGAAPAAAAPTAQAPAVTEVSTANLQAAQAAAGGGEAAAPATRQPRTTKAKEAAALAPDGSAAAIEALTTRLASVENALVRLAEFSEKQSAEIAGLNRVLYGLAGLSYTSFADANNMPLPEVVSTANSLGEELAAIVGK